MAKALKEAFEGTTVVLTPDLPLYPKEAMKEIRSIIDREAARLASGQQLRLFPRPDAGSSGRHSCPAGQSVFHDDGVSEGANRRA